MRTALYLFALTMVACTTKPNEEKPATEATSGSETTAVDSKGLSLIEMNDCQTCHHKKNVLVGPSYSAIASRYDNSNETKRLLVSKIINGGTGVWGDTPMNAHPTLSNDEAMEMVTYILSLE